MIEHILNITFPFFVFIRWTVYVHTIHSSGWEALDDEIHEDIIGIDEVRYFYYYRTKFFAPVNAILVADVTYENVINMNFHCHL